MSNALRSLTQTMTQMTAALGPGMSMRGAAFGAALILAAATADRAQAQAQAQQAPAQPASSQSESQAPQTTLSRLFQGAVRSNIEKLGGSLSITLPQVSVKSVAAAARNAASEAAPVLQGAAQGALQRARALVEPETSAAGHQMSPTVLAALNTTMADDSGLGAGLSDLTLEAAAHRALAQEAYLRVKNGTFSSQAQELAAMRVFTAASDRAQASTRVLEVAIGSARAAGTDVTRHALALQQLQTPISDKGLIALDHPQIKSKAQAVALADGQRQMVSAADIAGQEPEQDQRSRQSMR